MSLDSSTLQEATMTEPQVESPESSVTESESHLPPTILPRSGWNNQVAYLRALFRAKKALDRIEKEAGIIRP